LANVTWEINHGKANRVHKTQCLKEKKTNIDLQSTTQKAKY